MEDFTIKHNENLSFKNDDKNRQTLGEGFFILAISSVVSKILSLVFVPLIRGLLGGDAGYSVYYSAYLVYAFVYVLATAGFPVAISKLMAELSRTNHLKEANKSFKMTRLILFWIGFSLSAIVMIFSKPIAKFMNNEDSWAGIFFLAPTVFICALLSAYRGYFQGRKNMRPTAISQIAEQFVHVLCASVLVILLKDKGIVWAVAGASIGTCLGALVALVICILMYKKDYALFRKWMREEDPIRRQNNVRAIPKKVLWKKILYYSLPILVSSAVQYGGDLIDSKTIKGRLAFAGFSEEMAKILHGRFGAMKQLINVPGSLATALCVAVLPMIASAVAAKKSATVNRNTQMAFKLCYLVSVPVAFAYAVYSKPIYQLLGYGDSNLLLVLSSLSVILLCTIHLQSSVMQANNLMFTSSIFMCICVLVKLLFNYILVAIPGLNVYGAIISTYISYIIPFVLNYIVMKKKTGIKFSILRALAPTCLSSAISICGSYIVYAILRLLLGIFMKGYLVYLISFVPAAIIAVLGYYYVLRKLGGLSDDEINIMSKKLVKITSKLDKILKIS